jgi:hypothetical protein
MVKKNFLSNSRKFDAHEDPTGKERQEDHDKPDESQHDATLGSERLVASVEDDEAERTDDEHEARRQALHDVLPVYPVRHDGHLHGKRHETVKIKS